MGEKNSFDSSTLVNKCLELVEAHYLFNIPYDKLKILIHPEALVHSIIEHYNYNNTMNYFYHDMDIPLVNFLKKVTNQDHFSEIKRFNFQEKLQLNFNKPNYLKYPILKIFDQMDKDNPKNIIKFNCSNQYAFSLFKNGKINFLDIHRIIKFGLSIELKLSVKDINKIVIYQDKFMKILQNTYEN